MPAPYRNAREILEDAIAHNHTPYEEVRALSSRHSWDATQTLATLHAVMLEAERRDAALEIIRQADTIRADIDSPQLPAQAAALAWEAAIQVDHLDDDTIDEVLAILERAGY
jgi:hypothetical protein